MTSALGGGSDDVVYVPILPSFKDFGAELGKGAAGVGKKTGEQIGRDIAAGIESAKSRVEKATETVAKSQDKVADATGKLRVEETKLQELRDRGNAKAGQLAAAEERVEAARRRSSAATRDFDRDSRSLTRANDDLTAATDRSSDSGKRFSTNWAEVGRMGVVAAAGVAAAAAGIGAGLVQVALTFDDVSDTIRAGTGASGDALDGLVQSAKVVGTQVPAEFDKIGPTISTLTQRLGLTGPVLETVAEQLLEIGNMTGIDVDINQLSGAFNAFGVQAADSAATMDELWRVSQNTGVGINDLLASAQKGAPALKQFGFGIGESAGLVGQLDKAGLDADKTLAAMNKALVNFAKDGKDPQQALYGTVQQIDSLIAAGNEASALDLSASLFGTKGAAQFVDAVKAGTFSVDDFVSATGGSTDTVLGAAADTHDLAEQWLLLKNQVLVGIEPLATKFFGILTDGMTWLRDTGAPAVMQVSDAVQTFVQNAVSSDGFQNFVAFIRDQAWPMLQNIGTVALDIGQRALPILWGAFQTGVGIVQGIVGALVDVVKWFGEHEKTAITLASVITVGLLPTLVGLATSFVTAGTAAVVQGAVTAAAWVASQAKAVASAAVQVAANYRLVASWVLHGVTATAQAAVAAGAWVASGARTVIAVGAATAAFIAQRAVMVAGAVATGVMTAAQWALNVAMTANPIGLIIAALVALVAAVVLAYQNSETFRNIVQAAWEGIQAAVSFAWNNIIKPAFEWISSFIVDTLIPNVLDFWHNVMEPAFRTIGDVISWVWENVIKPTFDALKSGVGLVGDAFSAAVDFIGKVWDKIKSIAAKPVKFVVETVYNNGIRAAWNKVAGWLNLPELPEAPLGELAGYAYGGAVRGRGGPRDDLIPAMLSNGEYVMQASAVDRIGVDNLDRLNNDPVKEHGKVLGEGMFVGLAGGGSVEDALRRAAQFMQGEHGKPYQYGGVGDPSWDCSGLWSGIVHVLAGGSGREGRLFSTESDFESMGWRPGLGGPVSIGVMRGGGGPNSHMAGTLDGINAESSGDHGVQFGGPARGADNQMFGLQYFLPDFAGEFTSGGGGGGLFGRIANFLRRRVADAFDAIMNPIGAAIPSFGDSDLGRLPKTVFEYMRGKVRDFILGKAGDQDSGGNAAPGTGPVVDQVRQAMAAYGWDQGAQWAAVDWIVGKESGWNPTARNPSSGAFGLAQFLGSTKEQYLPDENPNPRIQGDAMARYIRDRYGDPLKAKAFWECLPLNTQILTRRGWVGHDEVRVGDETIGFNPETGKSEWTPITAVHHYADAPVFDMGNVKFKVRSTGNHRWVAQKFVQRTRGGSADPVDEFVTTECITSRHRLRLANEAETGAGLPITPEEAQILGWVMGDGSVTGHRVVVYQDKPEHLDELEALFKEVPHSHYVYERAGYRNPEHIWYLRSAYARDLLKRSGYEHKNPVPLILTMSSEQRAAFLKGFFGAEGWSQESDWATVQRASQKRGAKLDAASLAIYLNGQRPRLHAKSYNDVVDIVVSRAWIGGETLRASRKYAGREPVWCVTTVLGSWTAKQGDHIFLTGNSNGWYDNGGIASGRGIMLKDVIKPERVLDPDTTEAFDHLVGVISQPKMAEILGKLASDAAQWGSDTATSAAKFYAGDTLDFLGFGGLSPLVDMGFKAIEPSSQVSPELGVAPSSPADDETQQEPVAVDVQGGPLVQVNNPQTFDLEELVRMIFREANHLVRGDAISNIGGWGG